MRTKSKGIREYPRVGLPRPCRICGKRMLNHGRYQKICEDCYKERHYMAICKKNKIKQSSIKSTKRKHL
jgi:hypothetical protein